MRLHSAIDRPSFARSRAARLLAAALAAAAASLALAQAPTPPASSPQAKPQGAAESKDLTLRVPEIKLVRMFPNLTLRRPTQAVQAPGEPGTLYVVEQAGRVLRLDLNNDQVKSGEVFADIRKEVNDRNNEEGLLSLCFDPKYADNGLLYLYYTADKPRRSVLSQFHASDDRKTINMDSEKIILQVDQPYSNHNGGTVLFGPDGMLYLSLGDGGAANDPHGNGQNLGTLLASIVRLDVSHVSKESPYAIPSDNPFLATKGARKEIWAYGLRNVWRMSFDRESGVLWGGDVGQNQYEEIDVIVKGGNYGWNPREGLHEFPGGKKGAFGDQYIDPVHEYSHNDGLSVTGGYVYRGKKCPDLSGIYFFADYSYGIIWGARCQGSKMGEPRKLIHRSANLWSSFGELLDGELVLCSFDGGERGPGSLWKITCAN
ncbi:MAG: PQQ-dependent sugar dehydrogenase [Planctomycetes bacterium]|nr:PQQ-dependent sugar dehydrogenase [Planctomycetota bacterium]